jgi:hypothetical protein
MAELLCGASAIALTAFQTMPAMADKLPASPWTIWVEGGAQGLVGADSSIAGLTPPFTPEKKVWGWSGAAALDYRLDSVWHVSAGYRAGANKTRTTTGPQAATVAGSFYTGSTSASRGDSNWVADFMVGRDVGLGAGKAQIKFGLRVAQIKQTTDGGGNLVWTGGTSLYVTQSYSQRSKFTGYGPRLAVEGNEPISGRWSLDYMAGVAVLASNQDFQQTGNGPFYFSGILIGGTTCSLGCAATVSSYSDNKAIFNTDAMLGLAYAISESTKLAINYRVDFYANAMKTADSAGNISTSNRTFHGPNLRLQVKF